jgi:hypothetical protein
VCRAADARITPKSSKGVTHAGETTWVRRPGPLCRRATCYNALPASLRSSNLRVKGQAPARLVRDSSRLGPPRACDSFSPHSLEAYLVLTLSIWISRVPRLEVIIDEKKKVMHAELMEQTEKAHEAAIAALWPGNAMASSSTTSGVSGSDKSVSGAATFRTTTNFFARVGFASSSPPPALVLHHGCRSTGGQAFRTLVLRRYRDHQQRLNNAPVCTQNSCTRRLAHAQQSLHLSCPAGVTGRDAARSKFAPLQATARPATGRFLSRLSLPTAPQRHCNKGCFFDFATLLDPLHGKSTNGG